MIKLLARLFIKSNDISEPETRRKYGVLCGAVGIFLNICLFIGKFLAGSFANSIAITSDAFNNLSDAGSSVITLLGFKLSGQKPDIHHPFGHGRIEYLSGLIVSMVILLMGFELLKTSVEKVITPQPVEFSLVAVIILAASVLVKLYMVFYNRRYAKKTASAAMAATSADSLSDCIATSVVLIATLVAKWTGLQIDGYAGIIVSLFILWSGFGAAKDTISPLLGEKPSQEYVKSIESIVKADSRIIGLHDLIVHDYGPGRRVISLHAEVNADENLIEAHDTIDNLERRLSEQLGCLAVIHMDPICVSDARVSSLYDKVKARIGEIGEGVTMHDFRVVFGPTHTNMIFDIVLPFNSPLTEDEARKRAEQIVRSIDADSNAVVSVDRSFT